MNPPYRPTLFLLLFVLSVSLTAALPAAAAAAAEVDPPPLSPDHTPLYSITAGKSVPVSVAFEDPAELAEIRLYFKTMTADRYLFLPMTETGRGTFTANLPPARNWTKGIDYLLLRKSTRGEIRKSKPFRLLVMNDFSSPPPAAEETLVQAEDSSAATENHDFAVPLRVAVTPEPLLTEATEDPYPPVTVPGPGGGSSGIFGGLGGVSFSIEVGGVSFRYGSFSGR